MITVDAINFEGKKALIRVDFNVPLDQAGNVTDITRIEAARPTILKVLEDGGAAILMSHLGRPKQQEAEFSLQQICKKVSEVIGVEVHFLPDCVGPETQQAADQLEMGKILLLENLRYYKEETAGDPEFAKALAALGDVYVNDAFGTAHRAHASTTIIAKYFPQSKCFGYLLAKEIESLDRVLHHSEKPVLAVLGGAKVSSKITVIESILDKVDDMIIGGGMAYTFIKAQGGKVGSSICEDDKQQLALDILKMAEEKGVQIHLPVDVLAADDFSETAQTQTVAINAIPEGWQGLDAGPQSIQKFDAVVNNAKTILWNGPLGVFEMAPFATATIALGNSIANATKNGAFSLVGGGDSVAAVKQFDFDDKVSYVSTGGGAMLEMLEGKTLPGIAAIKA